MQEFVFLEHPTNESGKRQTRNIFGVHLGKKSQSHSKWVQYKSSCSSSAGEKLSLFFNQLPVVLLTVVYPGKLKCSGVISNIYIFFFPTPGLPWWLSDKESACNAEHTGDTSLIPRWGTSPAGGKGNPLHGESHEQRNLEGYSPWGQKEADTTDHAHAEGTLFHTKPLSTPTGSPTT